MTGPVLVCCPFRTCRARADAEAHCLGDLDNAEYFAEFGSRPARVALTTSMRCGTGNLVELLVELCPEMRCK
jgi:hypothetical protein